MRIGWGRDTKRARVLFRLWWVGSLVGRASDSVRTVTVGSSPTPPTRAGTLGGRNGIPPRLRRMEDLSARSLGLPDLRGEFPGWQGVQGVPQGTQGIRERGGVMIAESPNVVTLLVGRRETPESVDSLGRMVVNSELFGQSWIRTTNQPCAIVKLTDMMGREFADYSRN